MNYNNRLAYMDIFKGITILLVLAQHICGYNAIGKYILSFHMALFFFASGFVKGNSYNDPHSLIKKLIYFAKCNIFIGITNIVWYFIIIEKLLNRDYQQRWLDYFTTWFLPTLFWVLLINFVVTKHLKNKLNYVFVIIILLLISFLITFIPNRKFDIFHMLKAPLGSAFYYIGMLSSTIFSGRKYSMRLSFACAVVLAPIIWALERLNTPVKWYEYDFGFFPIFVLVSLLGIAMVFLISVFIEKCALLEYIGKNSMIFYCWNFIVYRVVTLVVAKYSLFGDYITYFISFIVSTLLLWIICKSTNKWWFFRYK